MHDPLRDRPDLFAGDRFADPTAESALDALAAAGPHGSCVQCQLPYQLDDRCRLCDHVPAGAPAVVPDAGGMCDGCGELGRVSVRRCGGCGDLPDDRVIPTHLWAPPGR